MNYPSGMLYPENLAKLAELMNDQAKIDESYRDAHLARGKKDIIGQEKAKGYAAKAKKLRNAAKALLK